MTWTYLVTNTGKTPLDGITVVDDRLPTSSVKCPKTRLNPGESMTCPASGAVK
ncbi:UNVERIFIED_CONTAM: transposase [Salmonella enterica subsp. enterica serovar Weltevreden]